MGNLKTFLVAAIACLTIVSGTRAQEYEWHITYPPSDSSRYKYIIHAVDCSGEVCTAVGWKMSGDTTILLCFRSTDGGETWKEQNVGLPWERIDISGQTLNIEQIDSLNAVASGDSGLVIKTSDGGNTWQRLNLNTLGQIYGIHFSDAMTGIVTKNWGYSATDTSNIMITHDGGETWIPSPFHPWILAMPCHSDGWESFRAVGYAQGPVYSTNDDWQTVDSTSLIVPLSDSFDVVILSNFKGPDTMVSYGGYVFSHTAGVLPWMSIFISMDGGESWNKPDIPDTFISDAFAMSSLDRDIVFCGGDGYGKIAVSKDHGATWEIDPYILDDDTSIHTPLHTIESIAVTNNNEGVGIFQYIPSPSDAAYLARGVPVTSGVDVSSITVQSLQIFPSPATNSITITYSSSRTVISSVQVQVLDVLGRDVLHGTVPSSGTLTLDVSSLPAGLYYVSDGHAEVKFIKN